ncbi:microcompartments protein [Alkaliphilus oremlandii OhILAs]|uniref:Microcompartments protein n=2 Tax=Alkaliphilus oremlandii TaxID=461876 RepID=A8MEM2_ALKOO|nr:microcompartments protein [Alkaliphilus oremlandii OhILAs]
MAKALGLIEVRGKLGAILAADAAIKAASVRLLGSEVVSGGLTTIHIIGDIAAVKAAVEAGVVAVADKNCLISSHVIPRLDDQVERMLEKTLGRKEERPSDLKESNESTTKGKIEEEKPDKAVVPSNGSQEISKENLKSSINTIVGTSFDKEDLEKMRVTDLRSLAYQSDLSTIKKSEIKTANKTILIEALMDKGVEH